MAGELLKALVEQYGVGDLLTGGVLLVDDDAPNLAVLGALLESDYTIHEAESGEQALEIVAREPLDVVLTDQRMPGMTGVELLEKIREIRPDIAGVVLTGYTDSPAIMSAINRAQVFRFMTKPWQSQDVLAAVEQAREHVYRTRAVLRLVEILSSRNAELAAAMDDLKTTQHQMMHMERLGTMGRLASGVTHDLRNFLMGLALLEQEFETRQDVDAELKDTITIGMAGIRNLLSTLETMNQFARSGQLGVALAPVSPATIIHDAVTVMRMDMDFRRRKVDVRVGADLPAVIADHRKLTQVMVNLIRNAVQATTQGQSVVIEAAAGPDGGVILAVEDEGCGIPSEVRERLFQPFMSSKGQGGMGMGLYMARLVLESHGGRIECLDRPGGGTRLVLGLSGPSV